MKEKMKKTILLFSVILLALSCRKDVIDKVVNLASLSADYEAKDGETLTGILGGNYKITIADGATVTLKDAVIYGVNSNVCQWAGITAIGDATLVLEASNIVRGFYNEYPGIYIPKDKTLRIKGSGKLDVSSNGKAPGIGGVFYTKENCGNIEILDGTIRAVAGEYCAAIGAAALSGCGNITISGGFVTGTYHFDRKGAAGIGTGRKRSRCGDILISGGTVVAEGGEDSAGIGSSYEATCGNITISGGTVTARGGAFAASIGSGSGSDMDGDSYEPSVCGNITISGGTVKAEGVNSISAAGIGSGVDNSVCGDILISGGTVDATGGDCSAGIGTGEKASAGNITITSRVTKVTAARGADAQSHSIGGGTDYKRLGTVTIGGKAGPVSESPFVYIP